MTMTMTTVWVAKAIHRRSITIVESVISVVAKSGVSSIHPIRAIVPIRKTTAITITKPKTMTTMAKMGQSLCRHRRRWWLRWQHRSYLVPDPSCCPSPIAQRILRRTATVAAPVPIENPLHTHQHPSNQLVAPISAQLAPPLPPRNCTKSMTITKTISSLAVRALAAPNIWSMHTQMSRQRDVI